MCAEVRIGGGPKCEQGIVRDVFASKPRFDLAEATDSLNVRDIIIPYSLLFPPISIHYSACPFSFVSRRLKRLALIRFCFHLHNGIAWRHWGHTLEFVGYI